MPAKNIQGLSFTRLEIQIARHIFKHYQERLNARQIARILGINHAHAGKLCNLLVGKQLLLKEEIGNAIYFTFDYGNELALKLMEYLLSQEEFPKWLVTVLYSLEKFKPYLKLGLVFGSSVKSKSYNDIDVLLVYDTVNSREVRKVKAEIRKSQLTSKPIRYMDLTGKDIFPEKPDKVLYNILSNGLVFCNPLEYAKVVKRCHKQKNI